MIQPIDEIRTGAYRQLFHPELLINGKEDAANNCTNNPANKEKDGVLIYRQMPVDITPSAASSPTPSLTASVASLVRHLTLA